MLGISRTICQHYLQSFLIVIQQLSKFSVFTASMFSPVVEVLGRPEWASSLKFSRQSLNWLRLNLYSVHNRVTKRHSQHFKCPCLHFFTQKLIQFLWAIFFNIKKSKSTIKHNSPLYLSETNWQSKMVDIVNICSRHMCQHNRKSNTCISRNMKITVIFFFDFLITPRMPFYSVTKFSIRILSPLIVVNRLPLRFHFAECVKDKFHGAVDFSKKKNYLVVKCSFSTRWVRYLKYLGHRKSTRSLTESNAAIMSDFLMRLVKKAFLVFI